MYECVSRATNTMQADQLDQAKILAYFEKAITDPTYMPWLPIIKKTATDCLSRTASKLTEIKKLFTDSSSNKKTAECNVGVLAFTECHMTEMFTACPAQFWTNTKECNDAKVFGDKCNNNVENVVMQYMVKVPK